MANPWSVEITAVEQQLGLPPGLLQAISSVENQAGDATVVSKAAFPGSSGGAVGILQVMPATFAALKMQGKLPETASITDPRANILAGGLVLQEGLKAAKGDIAKAVAYYNTTPSRALSGNLLPETQAYIPKVLAKYSALTGGKNSANSFMSGVQAPEFPGTTSMPATDSTAILDSIRAATKELFSALSADKALQVQTGEQLLNTQAVIKSSGDMAAKAAEEESIARAGQALIAGQRASTFEQTASDILSSLGMSPSQTDNFRGTTLAKIQDIAAEKSMLRKQIADRQSVGLFDNPITWLMNQLALPGEINKHNALVQMQLGAESDLQRNLAMTSTELGHATTIANQKLGAELVQQAQAEVAAGKEKVAALQAATAGNAAATALNIQALQSQEVKDDNMRLGIATDELTRARQAKELEMRQAQFDLMVKEHTATAELKAEKKAEYEATLANIKLTNDALGLNLTPAIIASMPPKQKVKLMEGMPMNGMFGGDVPGAILFTTQFANIPVMSKTNPTQAQFISALKKSLQEQESLWTPAEKMGKKPEEIEQLSAIKVGQKLLDGAKNTALGVFPGGGNPYRATYSALANPNISPELTGNIVSATIQSYAKSLGGVDKITDGMLWTAIAANVVKEDIPVDMAAAHIAKFYSVAKDINNKATKFEIYGLPTQSQYLAPIPGTSTTKVYDYSNEQVVKNLLLKALVTARVQEASMYVGGPLGGMMNFGINKVNDTILNPQQP